MRTKRFLMGALLACVTAAPSLAEDPKDALPSAINYASLGYIQTLYSADEADNSLSGITIEYNRANKLAGRAPVYFLWGLRADFGWKDVLKYGFFNEKITKADFSSMSLSIPVNIGYRAGINRQFAVMPYVGLHTKVNLISKIKTDIAPFGAKRAYSLFDTQEFIPGGKFNRLQTGWQLGAKVQYGPVWVGIEYGKDFNKINHLISTTEFSLKLGGVF